MVARFLLKCKACEHHIKSGFHLLINQQVTITQPLLSSQSELLKNCSLNTAPQAWLILDENYSFFFFFPFLSPLFLFAFLISCLLTLSKVMSRQAEEEEKKKEREVKPFRSRKYAKIRGKKDYFEGYLS